MDDFRMTDFIRESISKSWDKLINEFSILSHLPNLNNLTTFSSKSQPHNQFHNFIVIVYSSIILCYLSYISSLDESSFRPMFQDILRAIVFDNL